MMKTPPIFAAVALLSLLPARQAGAEMFQHGFGLSASVIVDSNPNLLPDSSEEVWRYGLSTNYFFKREDGVDTLEGGAGILLERSSDDDVVANREDPTLGLKWTRATATGEFALSADYAEASTLTSELLESTLVTTDATRRTARLGAKLRTELNARNTLFLDAGYQHVSYLDAPPSLQDYRELKGSVKLDHQVSERIAPYVHYSISHYESDASQDSSDSQFAGAGVDVHLSERLTGNVFAGMRWNDGEDAGWQGGAGVKYQSVRSSLSAEIGRYSSASGLGSYIEYDQIGVNWTHHVSEKLTAGVDIELRDVISSLDEHTYLLTQLWARRDISELWQLHAYYQHKRIDRDTGVDANANVLGLTLIYTYPDF